MIYYYKYLLLQTRIEGEGGREGGGEGGKQIASCPTTPQKVFILTMSNPRFRRQRSR